MDIVMQVILPIVTGIILMASYVYFGIVKPGRKLFGKDYFKHI